VFSQVIQSMLTDLPERPASEI